MPARDPGAEAPFGLWRAAPRAAPRRAVDAGGGGAAHQRAREAARHRCCTQGGLRANAGALSRGAGDKSGACAAAKATATAGLPPAPDDLIGLLLEHRAACLAEA